MPDKAQRLFMVTPVTEYNQTKIFAELVRPDDDGTWTSLDEYSSADDRAMRHLRVTAYIGHGYSTYEDQSPGEVWGHAVRFDPMGSIDCADHAMGIARAFARVERGLTKLRDAEGYPTGYAALLVHVARVLKVDKFLLRSSVRAQEMSGDRYRAAKGGDLDSWVHHLSTDIAAGKRANWVR
jgi:hypothetical protein